LKRDIDERFTRSGQLTLRDDNGSTVTLGDNQINIVVPAKIPVPNWFNADLDVAITLSVAYQSIVGRPPIRVSAPEVSFDVNWSFFENLASLGCGAIVERGMSKLGQVLMADIVKAEVVPAVARGLNDLAEAAMRAVQDADPLDRTWRFAIVAVSSNGLRLKICPA
jgi:hypothetical protein